MRLFDIPKQILLVLIRIYQKTLSPDHGYGRVFSRYAGCRFYPSCSSYGYEAINRYGLIKGVPLTIKRVARCHPWSHGGYDPVPDLKK